MAAEAISNAGHTVDIYDAMPSAGRKFLMAGKGGLNLTHTEAPEPFVARYGERSGQVAPWLAALSAADIRTWAAGLGIDTFVGSSGRVFPRDMKAAPLLRAWLHRLRHAGVRLHMRHRWQGWDGAGRLSFATATGEQTVVADATVLALGGGSWPQLGSDGTWLPLLAARGVVSQPLRPANCGFEVGWSRHFRERFAGQPVKSIAVEFTDCHGNRHRRQGEFMVTATGIEGGLIYGLSAPLRDTIEAEGSVTLSVDLLPDRSPDRKSVV